MVRPQNGPSTPVSPRRPVTRACLRSVLFSLISLCFVCLFVCLCYSRPLNLDFPNIGLSLLNFTLKLCFLAFSLSRCSAIPPPSNSGSCFFPLYFNSVTTLKNLDCVSWHASLIRPSFWLLPVFLRFLPYSNILFHLDPDESPIIFLLLYLCGNFHFPHFPPCGLAPLT